MEAHQRKKLGKKFTGLDKILYDRLNAKVGKEQNHGGGNFALGVVNAIPVVSLFSGSIGTVVSLNDVQIRLEKMFTIDEV